MRAVCLSGTGIGALLALAPAGALAQVTPGGTLAPVIQQPGHGSLYPTPIPPQGGMRGGFHRHGHGFSGGFVLYSEPEVVHDVVVVHDLIAEPPAPPPAPPKPREPWVLGRNYSALPGGCMKMIAGGASYYQCSGEWYRKVASGYRAVARP